MSASGPERLPLKAYERELYRLQQELVKLQEWVREEGARVVVLFEGRDAAGEGSTIKRVSEYLNPRTARIESLPTPTEREETQWYFQRYIEHLPAAGEILLFDRSWYNRAGVERVMGFCIQDQYRRFLHQCPIFERLLVEDGILLRKYWFSVTASEQERRFRERLRDPMRRWKLSTLDLESVSRWDDYSRAKDEMFVHTIVERTRELGVMRAVGMTRAQLRSAIRWESVIISLQGTSLGLLVGVFFGWALVHALADEGLNTFTVPTANVAVIVLLAALAGVAAAILPARRAARLDVLRAVVTE